jgi:hypothetical protein
MSELPQVKPGDLITADLLNALIDDITDLRDRVAKLETGAATGSSVRITAFNPPPPPAGAGQHLGQVLQIYGENFAWPPQSNTVTIQNFGVPSGGTATITDFRPGSRPNQLEFVIPTTIAGIVSSGTDVTVRVRNGNEAAQATYRLLPALVTNGSPPTIASVVRAADGNPNLLIGQQAVINGTNFGTDSAAIKLTLIVVASGVDIRYPDPAVPARPGPAINSTAPTQINFTVPDMAEIDELGRTITLELVLGNFPSVETFVNVRRPVT